jgi:GNAT superfamily N-acetyltransferase
MTQKQEHAVEFGGQRQAGDIQIVRYEPRYQQSFKKLNEEWITRWFAMEEADYKALDHPQEYILDAGGTIFMALQDGEPVGTCAMIKMDDSTYELAKMSVSDRVKGKGIGYLLGQAIIDQAKTLGAQRLYLESNTLLKPALGLYRKLGFQEVQGFVSPYQRCDIQMELILK